MIYFTELDNLPTYDAKGRYLGSLQDLAIDPSKNALRVAAFLLETPRKQILSISHVQVQSISVRAAQTNVPVEEICPYTQDEGLIRIRKDVLDQQIIDVNDQKVVRVNDVDFEIEPNSQHTDLRIVAVNVGLPAAVRRLMQGLLAKHSIRKISNFFAQKTIPWEFVNLIEPDPARRVKLRISYNRLAELHPADLADILEELSRDEQKSVIESLDDEVAAEAVSEIPTRMQVALLDSLPAGRAADILEEMAPDEAADVLQELPPETSAQVLANMESDEAEEVRELLGFEENTAGGLMTTEYLSVEDNSTVDGVVAALTRFEGPLDSVHAVFIVNQRGVLTGVVPIARLLLAPKETAIHDLSADSLISIPYFEHEKIVMGMFRKYNLVTLPVVDDDGRLMGVVTADDVFELVVKET